MAFLMASMLLTPLLACAQDSDNATNGGRLENILWGVAPFLVLGVLFWWFSSRKHPESPAEARQRLYVERQHQHMQRVEQLLERIAVALEQRKPQ